MLIWIHSHDMSQPQLGTYCPLTVSCSLLGKGDRLTGQEREVVGFVLLFRNFFHEAMPWTTPHFCMALRHSCLGRTLVFVSAGHTRQRVFELDRMEISRTDSSPLIVDIEVNITRASLM